MSFDLTDKVLVNLGSRNDLSGMSLPIFDGLDPNKLREQLVIEVSPLDYYPWESCSSFDVDVKYYSPEIDGVKCETPWMKLPNQEACLMETVKSLLRNAESTAKKAVKKVRRFVDYLLHDAGKREKAMVFFHEKLDYGCGKTVAVVMAAAYRAKIVIDRSYTWMCVKAEFHMKCSTSGITKYYVKETGELLTNDMPGLVYDMENIMRQEIFGDANPYVVTTKKQ